jgi:hypothetical protein
LYKYEHELDGKIEEIKDKTDQSKYNFWNLLYFLEKEINNKNELA